MKVAVIKKPDLDYCREAPYHPPERYPEYPFPDLCPGNRVYPAVRELLFRLGLDRRHYGEPSWNPLGDVIRPGDHVFIKPNLVGHRNPAGGTECLITRGSVIRAIADYASIALQGKGRLTIGDSPQLETDFAEVVRITGIGEIAGYYRKQGLEVGVLNLMKVRGRLRKIGGVEVKKLHGDPMGYRVVDLKSDSEHFDIIGDCAKFRVADYDRHEMIRHHNKEKNEYCISASVLDADVVISVPKLKTHAKSGMTCALKNMIGINGAKDWLPHHRAGPAEAGGDEYARSDLRKDLFARLKDSMSSTDRLPLILPMRAVSAAMILSRKAKPFRDPYLQGSWPGNDTLPRTIADINKIVMYADKGGIMRDTPQRKLFLLVDGIVAGEKEGPMSPEPKRCGVLAAGFNPVAVDAVCSRIMGFDYLKIPFFRYALNPRKYPLCDGEVEDIEIIADGCDRLSDVYEAFNCALEPPESWKGHIEYQPPAAVRPEAEKKPAPLKSAVLQRH
ncbi:MAG: hypothetical protein A4E28_02147 [Methanocella sp. PtaU1.Bin125]|nr:MAG: hypothetical protein A4E28_02147 [Methanocella sp. PtaU1.Bin125]